MKGRDLLFPVTLLAAALGGPIGAFAGGQDPTPPQTAENKTPSSSEKEFTIRSDVRLVLLDVSVKDSKGGLVSGLKQDDFTVLEDGKPQKITQFANQDIPVTVGVVVDESGSMRPKRAETITAALTFLTASNPEDEVFVINFNDKVYHGLPDTVLFTDNINLLRTALMVTPPEGRTALYDALFASLHQLDMGRKGKKTLVVVSDGGDNISTHTRKEVQAKVEETLATIYTIGIFDTDDMDRNPDVLKWIASVSGGVAYFPEKLEGIVPICKQIAKDIRTRYTIGYIPAEGKAGVLRHIKVVVGQSGDRGKLSARTRTQYIYNPESADQ
ncbi:MAG: VWA domain-containing protein [Bryobacteraceae bacterium]|jgi:VWFA-related protein